MNIIQILHQLHPLDDVIVVTAAIITGVFIWRSKATGAYKETADAYGIRIKQLETDFERLTKENHELRAQVNQLIGENKTLREVVAKPDASFNSTIESILKEIKNLSEQQVKLNKEFIAHAKQDDQRFGEIGTGLIKIQADVLANRDFYVKTIKELKG